MALTYKNIFLPEFDFFWATYAGEVTMGELTKAHQAFKTDPAYASNLDELLDFTQCSFKTLSSKQIDTMHKYLLEQPSRDNNKSAIIVGSEVEFGLARMLSVRIDDVAPVDRAVFYTADEALMWLRPHQAEDIKSAWQKANSN